MKRSRLTIGWGGSRRRGRFLPWCPEPVDQLGLGSLSTRDCRRRVACDPEHAFQSSFDGDPVPAAPAEEEAMDLLHPLCAGLDVHKDTVVACLRRVVEGRVKRELRTFGTTTRELLELSDWLASQGCRHVAMEANGRVLEAGVAHSQ